jgi:hypothetical protein
MISSEMLNPRLRDQVIAGEKLIVTAGAVDSHVQYVRLSLGREITVDLDSFRLQRQLHLSEPLEGSTFSIFPLIRARPHQY